MTSFYGAADLDAMLREVGVPVELWLNGQPFTGYGILDEVDSASAPDVGGTLIGRVTQLTVKTGAFPGIAEGVLINVDGNDRTIVAVRQRDDGALTAVYLKRE